MFDSMAQGVAWDALVAVFGRSVTHTPSGGDAVSVTAIWRPGEMMPDYAFDGEQTVEYGVLTVNSDDVTVSLDDTFSIGSGVWAVRQIGPPSPLTDCMLVRRTQVYVGGANERIER